MKISIQRSQTKRKSLRSRRKFLHHFPGGFKDQKYKDWERNHKWEAHLKWQEILNREEFNRLLDSQQYREIAARTVKIESRTNLLFSFEKMALRDAVKSEKGARAFSLSLFEYIYGTSSLEDWFEIFLNALSTLPRFRSRVVSWPVVTVFGFIANPSEQIFLKPQVTKTAAKKYNYDFFYHSRPNWQTYNDLRSFATQLRSDMHDLKPRDLIDIQSLIWLLGSQEY